MGIFNQRRDTVEWIEYRPDVLFYKWKNREYEKGQPVGHSRRSKGDFLLRRQNPRYF